MAEKIGLAGSFFIYKFGSRKKSVKKTLKTHGQVLELLLRTLEKHGIEADQIGKIGHRVVHGGEKFTKPLKLGVAQIKELKRYNKLAPLHNPNNLAGIEACREAFSTADNYAVFDTAFHCDIPSRAHLYPLPMGIYKKYHVRKYGFHGISCEYSLSVAIEKLKNKKPNLIVCHLGGGCSVTAIKAGKSFDTSMGFSPLEGVMMTSRSGDIDPAITFHLLHEGMSVDEIEELYNYRSGLKGVSGMKDMRDIMLANGYKIPGYKSPIKFNKKKKELAELALDMFVYRVRKYIGAYVSVLGKVDAIVFTAGIGERNKDVRNLIMKNYKNKPRVLVVQADEERMILNKL